MGERPCGRLRKPRRQNLCRFLFARCSHHGQSTGQDLVEELLLNLRLCLEVLLPSSEDRRSIPACDNYILFGQRRLMEAMGDGAVLTK